MIVVDENGRLDGIISLSDVLFALIIDQDPDGSPCESSAADDSILSGGPTDEASQAESEQVEPPPPIESQLCDPQGTDSVKLGQVERIAPDDVTLQNRTDCDLHDSLLTDTVSVDTKSPSAEAEESRNELGLFGCRAFPVFLPDYNGCCLCANRRHPLNKEWKSQTKFFRPNLVLLLKSYPA